MKFRHFYRDLDTIGGGNHPEGRLIYYFNLNDREILKNAKLKAKKLHDSVNHKYDGKNYFITHILKAFDIAVDNIYLIPVEHRLAVLIAVLFHDAIEDARVTYNDIKNWFGIEVAEIVYALTNDKGRTRKERAGAKYYRGIRNTPYATFVKLCDRLANVTYSKEAKSTMFKVYSKENVSFVNALKGRTTWLGKLRYAISEKFDLFEVDYSNLYQQLGQLLAPEDLTNYEINYTEV